MPNQSENYPEHSFGDYRLVRKLGGGGFGTVYLAEHIQNQKPVAVKVLNVPLAKSQEFKDFLNEARTIRLRHPHIVPLLDFGISRNDLPFLVMEYAQGTLKDRHPKGERLALSTIIPYVDQIASALQYAHDQRVIHRDVKPANILVRANGTLMVSDFGIAKYLEQSLLISREKLAGTPEYMAPEQHRGHPCFASDQYSLAIVVYEWICGVRPFEGTIFVLATQHMHAPVPPLRDHLPEHAEDIEHVIMKALAKAPEDRFGRIQDFADALREATQLPLSPIVLSTPIETSNTVPPTPPEQISQSPFDQKPETVMHTFSNMKTALPEPAVEATDGAVSRQELASKTHAPPQDPPTNVSLSTPHTPPPAPAQPKRRHGALILLILIFILIGSGSFGVYTAIVGKTGTSYGKPISLTTPTRGSQASTTTTTPAKASTTAEANVTAITQTNPTATTQANPTTTTSISPRLSGTWHTQSSGTSQSLDGIAWSGSLFVAVGKSGTILTSTDGITWTPRTSGTSQTLYGVTESHSQFVAVGTSGTILTSSDGITWTPRIFDTSASLAGIASSGSLFVTVGASGTILTSSDGITWTPRNSNTSASLAGIAWSGSLFVAVGNSGTILTSSDGITWTTQISNTSASLSGIAWSSSQFVAVGNIGIILTSTDGINWTFQTSGVSYILQGVGGSGSQFVVVGIEGIIHTSTDGINWTSQSSGTSASLAGIVWSGSQFVVVGSAGTILTSS